MVSEGGLPWRYAADGSVAVQSPPKETRMLSSLGEEREYVFEQAIRADYGFVRAATGDRHGNLVFEKSTRNFNPLAAMSGRISIAEVDQIVEPGSSTRTRSICPASTSTEPLYLTYLGSY